MNDPNELRNVYDDPGSAEEIDELERVLFELRELYDVPEEDPVPYPDEG